jgi:transposase
MAKCTFKQFQEMYPDDASCLAKMMEVNYGGTEIACPGCGKDTKFHPLAKRRAFVCQLCGHHIYPCAGTIFHKSPTNLTKWFFAMYLMTSTRHGVAAKEIERQLGVTYKCAWRMCHELRKLMASADYAGTLGGPGGHVEIDETYMGRRQKVGRRGRPRATKEKTQFSNKTMVFGMVERDGNLRAGPVPNAWQTTVEPIVRAHVQPGSTVTTDEHGGYNDLHLLGMAHDTVKHTAKEYVRGIHHTNTIEGHWSHFKRAVKGTHVHISAKHLWKYCAEFNYRRNYRSSQQFMFDRLVAAFALPRLQDV